MKQTLYDINEEYLRLMQQVEENEGEMTPELEQALAINEENHSAKLESYAAIIANYNAEAEACKAESKRLKDKADRVVAHAQRLKDAIVHFLTVTDRRKVAAGTWSMSLRDTEAVSVTDEAAIPADYWREKVERSVDRMAVKAAIKGGTEIPGCTLVTNTSLQIK